MARPLAFLLLGLLSLAAPIRAEEPVTVFAAASTITALEEAAERYAADGHPAPRLVFASSGILARQIDNGAPADLFLSANRRWMEWLARRGMIEGRSVDLLKNRLVLIQPYDAPGSLKLDSSLTQRLTGHRLALGDPDHVPAGIYAKAALESMGLWMDIEDRVVRLPNVRAALLLVERGEAMAGIVYATDAAISAHVRIADTVPAGSHPPIVYPAAVVSGNGRGRGQAFLDFLQTRRALAVFERHGFAVD